MNILRQETQQALILKLVILKKANTNATKLLQNTTIKNYINERIKEVQEESLMSITEALALSASIARGEPQKHTLKDMTI